MSVGKISCNNSACLDCSDLWVLVNLLRVLLIAVDVQPDRRSGAACAAQTENNSGTIGKDDPEPLRETRKDGGEQP